MITDVFPAEAISTYNRGEIYNLCETIFVDDGELWDKIGRGAICSYNLEKSCDADAINRGTTECQDRPWLRTVIDVKVEKGVANPYPGMELTLQNFWNAAIT